MDDDATVDLERISTHGAVIPFDASHPGNREHNAGCADSLGQPSADSVASAVTSMEPKQPKLSESASASATDSKIDSDSGADVFFRISHTQLGRHKFFDKGAVATHDLGIQMVPVLRTDGMEVLLDMSVDRSDGGTKLTTWMSESAVSFEELRNSWKVWKISHNSDTRSGTATATATSNAHAAGSHSSVWDVSTINLHKYIPSGTVDILGDCRRALLSLVEAAAFPGSEHSYIIDETEEPAMNELDRAGLVVCEMGTYKLLGCTLCSGSRLQIILMCHVSESVCHWFCYNVWYVVIPQSSWLRFNSLFVIRDSWLISVTVLTVLNSEVFWKFWFGHWSVRSKKWESVREPKPKPTIFFFIFITSFHFMDSVI